MEASKESVILVTDGAYPMPGNQKLAEKISISYSQICQKKANDFYAGFELSENGKEFLTCSGGIKPIFAVSHIKIDRCG